MHRAGIQLRHYRRNAFDAVSIVVLASRDSADSWARAAIAPQVALSWAASISPRINADWLSLAAAIAALRSGVQGSPAASSGSAVGCGAGVAVGSGLGAGVGTGVGNCAAGAAVGVAGISAASCAVGVASSASSLPGSVSRSATTVPATTTNTTTRMTSIRMTHVQLILLTPLLYSLLHTTLFCRIMHPPEPTGGAQGAIMGLFAEVGVAHFFLTGGCPVRFRQRGEGIADEERFWFGNCADCQ